MKSEENEFINTNAHRLDQVSNLWAFLCACKPLGITGNSSRCVDSVLVALYNFSIFKELC